MIFYFSGTGNSEGIAIAVSKYLDTQAIDIVGRKPEEFSLEEEEYVGFVFPVYAWAAPEVMIQFAEKIHPKESYTFAIATFSNVAGMALEQFAEVITLKSGFGVIMPDNYPVTERVLDTPESSIKKLADAKKRLEEILPRIKNKENGFDVKRGEDAEDNTYVKAQLFNKNFRKTASYHVSDNCTGCGVCQEQCPADVIEIKDGKPVWVKSDCYLCMSCLNRCPVEAIEYGPYSNGRWRYYFRGFEAENYK